MLRVLFALIAVVAFVATVGVTAASATAPTGLCGPYDDGGLPGPWNQYRQQGYYNFNNAATVTAYIDLKRFDMQSASPNDLVAGWVMMDDNGPDWIEAGVSVGNPWGGSPELYVEVHNPTENLIPVAPASVGVGYQTVIHRQTNTTYYVTFSGGGHSYRSPSSGYYTYPATLNADTWAVEEEDGGDACPWADFSFSGMSSNPANDSFYNDPGIGTPAPYNTPNQTWWQLKSSGYVSGQGGVFESWGNNCVLQGKCQSPIR